MMLKRSVAYSQFFIKRKVVLLMERSFGYILNSEIVDKTQVSRPLIDSRSLTSVTQYS